MSSQYGKLRRTKGWDRFRSLGHPRNSNGFCVLTSLMQRHRSSQASQTLQDVWPFPGLSDNWIVRFQLQDPSRFPGLVHYIYIFRALAPWQSFVRCKIHFMSKSCILLYWQPYCTALQQRASAKLCRVIQGMALWNFRRGCHLYSAGRPSRRASVHILVVFILRCSTFFWLVDVCFCYVRFSFSITSQELGFGNVSEMTCFV